MRHDELMELVLQYEDLGKKEQEIARAHLQQCLPCRDMLEKIQTAEILIRDTAGNALFPLDSNTAPKANLAGVDAQQADTSEQLLLSKVSKKKTKAKVVTLGWSGGLIAIAASLMLLFGIPGNSIRPSRVNELRLTAPNVQRGDSSSELRAGDAFVVRFTPSESGWPVVVAEFADGPLKLLSPVGDNAFKVVAGQPVVLPPAGAPFTWRMESTDTAVWVVISTEKAPDSVLLANDLAEISKSSVLKSYLSEQFGSEAVSVVPISLP